jgi:glucoamylase
VSRDESHAPGAPGSPEVWTPGSKVGVGAAVGPASLVWFTLGRGAVEEVYFPRADDPNVRGMAFAVADGRDFFSWEKDDCDSEAEFIEPGVPAYRLTNRCRRGRYRIEKEVLAHPDRAAVVQRARFIPERGQALRIYVVLNPHLSNKANGWVGDYKGEPMLFAEGGGTSVALACSAPWRKRSAGFVGASDGWRDLAEHKRMEWGYAHANGGNVALAGEIGIPGEGGEFLLALGFGLDADAAGLHARAAVLDGFDSPMARASSAWRKWQSGLLPLDDTSAGAGPAYRASTVVMRAHEAKVPPGAIVASLAIPFGQDRRGDDTGGYHLVWPRDLAETAGGLLAAGAPDHARATLAFLEATQEGDGHWSQNMWLNGHHHWDGIQMDETSMAVLLLELARREGAVKAEDVRRFWPMVRKAAAYLVRNGPVTPEDRWEHDGGYSPFTLGAEIAALLATADFAEENREPGVAAFLRETADSWNASIERWTYVTGTELAKKIGVEGYYIRLGQPQGKEREKGNREPSVSPDALALVRFGLRRADDPRIVNTVKAIDAALKVDLGYGPGWRRYVDDPYGEHPDGSAYAHNHGVGRAWPLFAGERGHYELAAGRPEEAERMLRLMEKSATSTGLIPEQVWDAADIPAKGLFRGRPTTSACPLVWAHAEYVKLLRSVRDGAVFDLPRAASTRYAQGRPPARVRFWRFNHKIKEMPAGAKLRVEARAAATVRWTANGWKQGHEAEASDTGLGLFVAELPTEGVEAGGAVAFTFRWTEAGRDEGQEFRVAVTPPDE